MWKLLYSCCLALTVYCVSDICLASEVLPAMFIFGDSILEVGNNNYIPSLSKADFVPNGIDFGGPTGRFTNGRTIIDILGQQIGVDGFIPPYLAPTTTGPVILKGVNYASGSGGILKQTGTLFIANINMDEQIDNFANTRENIVSMIGKSAAEKLLRNNSLFTVAMGSNDFINNYLIPIISTGKQILIPPEIFVSNLIKSYRIQFQKLHAMDARKFLVANVPPIGCIPYLRDTNLIDDQTHCFEYANHLAQMFNNGLEILLTELSTELEGFAFVYSNTYHMFSDIVQNYISYGFESADSACCYLGGRYGGLIPCSSLSHLCPDRSKYVFWDPYHPTDAANAIIAYRLFNGGSPDVWPMNVQQILKV